MIIRPSDMHAYFPADTDKARLAVVEVAEALGVECDCRLTTMWVVRIDEKDRKTFVELAKDANQS